MKLIKTEKNQKQCVIVSGEGKLISDSRSALDLLMSASFEEGTKNIVIAKEQIAEEFFVLSTGLAGEILQKLVNYGGRLAVYGDFSGYTSKPLRDFIYESNKGKDIFFVRTAEEAVDRLTR